MTRPDPAPLLPVAGWRYLTPALAPHARAFDRFVTAARSIADEATWAPDRRRGVLEACAARLAGGGLGEAGAPALPEPLAEATQVLAVTLTATGIGADSARHVLQALQKETRGLWLRTWGELMVHGQYAAAPRGRFLAALMGERGRRLCRAAEARPLAQAAENPGLRSEARASLRLIGAWTAGLAPGPARTRPRVPGAVKRLACRVPEEFALAWRRVRGNYKI